MKQLISLPHISHLNKTNMKKLLIVAALGFLTACNSNNSETTDTSSGENNVKTAFVGGPTPGTNFINKDTANIMLQSYQASLKTDSNSLKSLIVDANDLRAYLADSAITNVKLMFAHTLDYIHSGHSGQPCGYQSGALTLILAGYDAEGNYKYFDVNNVMDHARPCPTLCPTNGTAQYNTFPQ
jgi:hypothetical protein